MDSTFDLLTLQLLPGLTARSLRDLMARAPAAELLARPQEHVDLLGERACARLGSGEARRRAEGELAQAGSLGIRLLGRDEPQYPAWLRRIYDPPGVLYVRGGMEPNEGAGSVAIVGARAASAAGQVLARAMARDLGAAGAAIVSGLARGIDAAAHAGALEAGGRTIAVLGSGLDRVYPEENGGLAEAICRGGGAVVSEFPLGTPPFRGNFPRRNRLIAGWGRAVVVVEAAERSGALVTARLALEEGREVMAVPGFPGQKASAGTNQLIRDGARLVRHALDVAEELGLTLVVAPGGEDVSDEVLAAVQREVPSSVEEIQERSGQPAAAVLSRLALLEMGEKIRRLPGALFVRN